MGWQTVQDARLRDRVMHTRLTTGWRVRHAQAGLSQAVRGIFHPLRLHRQSFSPAGPARVIEVPDGIAHFLEHQLFEDESGHVFNAFADLGVLVNVYTSHTMTSYLFSTTDNFSQAFDRLLDFVQAPHFTDAGVEKEIGIIEQEIQMYQDQPRHRLMMNLLQALYHVHPVRIDIAGTPDRFARYHRGNAVYVLRHVLSSQQHGGLRRGRRGSGRGVAAGGGRHGGRDHRSGSRWSACSTRSRKRRRRRG